MWAVNAHGYMEENDVKSACAGTKLQLKIKKDAYFFIQNLTRTKFSIEFLIRSKTFN